MSRYIRAPEDSGGNLRETYSCWDTKEIFRQSFDMEARALKILDNLLPVQGYPGERHLGPDEEGRGPGERMLQEFLPNMWRELRDLEERVCIIDGCSSQEEYRYHVLKEHPSVALGHHHIRDLFEVSPIMVKERRKVVAAGKCPEETVVVQVAKENEAVEDVEATIVAKRGLECTLEEADAEVTRLRLAIPRFLSANSPNKGRVFRMRPRNPARGWQSFSPSLRLLEPRATGPGEREVELMDDLEASRAEVARL
ncbi:hypothetical protein ACLOJK_036465 [Asimina triloba]